MKYTLPETTLAWKNLGFVFTLCLGACGGGTSFDATSPLLNATVASFSSAAAVAGMPTTFTVMGSNFPSTVSVELSGGSCASPTNVSSSSFSVVCTPGQAAGSVYMYVYSKAVTSGGSWLGQQPVTISATVPVNTITALTDTGIGSNQCFGAGSDVLISCASAAATALNSQQDGMVGRDAVANVTGTDGWLGFSYSAFGTNCIQDLVTGLTWQSASTTLSYVTAPATNPIQLAYDAETAANANALCGNTGWRLPSRLELQSLLHYGASNIAIDMNWLGLTNPTGYLSGEPYFTANRSYWSVDFAKGNTGLSAGITGSSYEVRLVRGASAISTLTLSPNGTEVTDSRTGLTWQRCTVGQSWNGSSCVGPNSRYSHEQALALAKAPWRVPNVKELSSLVGGSLGMAIDASVFAVTQPAGYWTSTPDVRTFGSAWSVNFSDGSTSSAPRSNFQFLRLVR